MSSVPASDEQFPIIKAAENQVTSYEFYSRQSNFNITGH
jgi:hypothetical protein